VTARYQHRPSPLTADLSHAGRDEAAQDACHKLNSPVQTLHSALDAA
jgi:hypothetical protein